MWMAMKYWRRTCDTKSAVDSITIISENEINFDINKPGSGLNKLGQIRVAVCFVSIPYFYESMQWYRSQSTCL